MPKLATFLAFVLCGAAAQAQDTRSVSEPAFPPVCSTLASNLAIVNGDPASETSFDTARIQSALNLCPAGQGVELQASGSNFAFLTQPISIPSSVTLIVDGGVTVYASRNPADYQKVGGETCGTIGTKGGGCNAWITVNNGSASSGSGLMGYGILDGRGNEPPIVGGVAGTQNWWDITTSDSTSRTQNKPVMLNANSTSSFTLYKITFRNAPYFNVQWSGSGFTAWGVKTNEPGSSPNTDGIDPAGSNVTISNAFLSDGDDHIAVKASNAVANITVQNTNTFSGHGISVGSQTNGGLTNMLVTNINQYGDGLVGGGNGLRIKSDSAAGGLVQNVTFQNICSTNVDFPLVLDPFYDNRTGTLYPVFRNIVFRNYHSTTNGKYGFEGYDAAHTATVTFDNVVLDGLTQSHLTPAMHDLAITLGPGPVTALLATQTGTNLTYTNNVTNPTAAPFPCTAANFTFLPSELYLSTDTAQNQQNLTLSAPASFTLNATINTAKSQLSYISYEATTYTGVAAPTASVAFFEGATQVGSAALAANGTLSAVTLTAVPAGTHTYTAKYLGDSNYAAFTFGSVSVTVTQASTTTSLLAAPAVPYAGQAVTLTATVASAKGTPTGTVNISGTTLLGSPTLAGGQASVTTTPLAAGFYTYSAVYSGDAAHSTSTSANVTVNVVPAFTFSASPASLTLGPGASASSTLTALPAAGFAGTIAYTCVPSVSYIACAVGASNGNVSVATFTVAATVSESQTRKPLLFFACIIPFSLLALRRRPRALLTLFLVVTLIGCGSGGSSSGAAAKRPPAGTQSAIITASSTTGGITTTQTATISITITN